LKWRKTTATSKPSLQRTRPSLAGALALVFGLALGPPAQALVILQYHHISDDTPAATSISPRRFREHLEAIEDSGYRVVDLDTVAARIRAGEALPDKAVLITFDDSYISIFDTAFPMLRKRHWPFVVFANTEPVDLGLAGFLSWDQLRELAAGGAAIANHSVSHPHMARRQSNETDAAWRERMRAEITGAERRIREELGQNHRVFAYPYGEFSADLQALLAELDYIAMAQHSGGASSEQALAMPRFPFGGIYGEPADFFVKLRARPMPLKAVTLTSESGVELKDGLLPLEVSRPVVTLQLNDSQPMDTLQCYVSGQGEAPREQLDSTTVRFQAAQPVRLGRSRYNCTAKSRQAARFYWFSVPFLRRAADGSWPAEP